MESTQEVCLGQPTVHVLLLSRPEMFCERSSPSTSGNLNFALNIEITHDTNIHSPGQVGFHFYFQLPVFRQTCRKNMALKCLCVFTSLLKHYHWKHIMDTHLHSRVCTWTSYYVHEQSRVLSLESFIFNLKRGDVVHVCASLSV